MSPSQKVNCLLLCSKSLPACIRGTKVPLGECFPCGFHTGNYLNVAPDGAKHVLQTSAAAAVYVQEQADTNAEAVQWYTAAMQHSAF